MGLKKCVFRIDDRCAYPREGVRVWLGTRNLTDNICGNCKHMVTEESFKEVFDFEIRDKREKPDML